MDVAAGPAVEFAEGELKMPGGVAIAALFAGVIGLLVLGISNILANVNAPLKSWMTLNAGIGPYSGKELFMFVAWFGSWVVLHFSLRKREVNVRKWFGVFLGLVLVAVLLVWPPIFEAIVDVITGA